MSLSMMVTALGWTLLHFLWQGAVIALVLSLTLQCSSRASSSVRYAAACVALLMMSIALPTTFFYQLWLGDEPVVLTASNPDYDALGDPHRRASPPPVGIQSAGNSAVLPPIRDVSAATRTSLKSKVSGWLPCFVAIWLTGATCVGIRLLISWRAVRKLQHSSQVLLDGFWMERIEHLKKQLKVSRPVCLFSSLSAAVPMVVGFFKPAILIPAGLLTTLSPAQLEAILAHELAHIRRHDYLINHFQSVLETIAYYHPAVWWVSGRVRIEREHCCDDIAARITGSTLEYARALAALEDCRPSRLALGATGGSLLQRIRRLAGLPDPHTPRPAWPAGLLALVIGGIFLANVIPIGAQSLADGSAHPMPTELTLDLGNQITMKFVHIPAGKFIMGSPLTETYRDFTEVPHDVTLTHSFYAGVTPVTVDQFAEFVKSANYKTDAEKEGASTTYLLKDGNLVETKLSGISWRNPGFDQTGNHPVVQVSWTDAHAFCLWLSRKSGRIVALPTEAQWEYACRAGSTTPYFWGEKSGGSAGYANIADLNLMTKIPDAPAEWTFSGEDDGFAFTSPVASFKPNAFGLYDMTGNVWQWCFDRDGGYSKSPVTNPVQHTGESRILRGGSWTTDPAHSRTATRSWCLPSSRSNDYGFRVFTAAQSN